MTVYSNGTLLQNRYEVRDFRMGGMGIVYYCSDTKENMPVALKTFQDKYFDNWDARDSFVSECQIWIGLEKQPNIVQAYRVETISGQPFVCIELVPSGTGSPDLRTRMRRSITTEEALLFAIDICLGMEQALIKYPKLVHRDLKPENILITSNDRCKVTDFGLSQTNSKLADDVSDGSFYEDNDLDGKFRSVKNKNIAGTPPYMAPEQWQGGSLDSRTDIYAFGCILFELLTGKTAFSASSFGDYKRLHLSYTPQDKFFGAHSELAKVVYVCLEKDVANRFSSFTEIKVALVDIYQDIFKKELNFNVQKEILAANQLIDYGMLYQLMDDQKTAGTFFQRAVELDPASWKGWNNLGASLLGTGKSDKGFEALTKSLELNPNNPFALCNIGLFYQAQGNIESALKYFDMAYIADPKVSFSLVNKAMLLKSQDKEKEYQELVEIVLKDNSYNNPALRLKLKYSQISKKEYTSTYIQLLRSDMNPARRLMDLLNSDVDKYDPSQYSILFKLMEQGVNQAELLADDMWITAVQQGRTQNFTMDDLSNFRAMGLSEESTKYWFSNRKAFSAFFRYWLRIQLASLFLKNNDRKSALLNIELATDNFIKAGLNETNSYWKEMLESGYMIFGVNAFKESIFDISLVYLEKAASSSENPDVLWINGECLRRIGRIGEAKECFLRVLEITPGRADATSSLQQLGVDKQ